MADLLIVEDNADVADTLAEVLRGEGHAVRIARNGQEGLRLVAQRLPDLVLLDVEMPVLTGPEMAYKMLLRDAGEEKVPVILLSGVADLRSVAGLVGTPYSLAKPAQLDELLALVAQALGERYAPAPQLAAE
jgi:CheY-like chemotaxis protein